MERRRSRILEAIAELEEDRIGLLLSDPSLDEDCGSGFGVGVPRIDERSAILLDETELINIEEVGRLGDRIPFRGFSCDDVRVGGGGGPALGGAVTFRLREVAFFFEAVRLRLGGFLAFRGVEPGLAMMFLVFDWLQLNSEAFSEILSENNFHCFNRRLKY